MKRFILLFLPLVPSISIAADIDYRALNPLFFQTNAGIVKTMWGSNSVTRGLTNLNSALGRVEVAGTNSIITADTGPVASNWLFKSQTNGNTTFKIRSDGSIFQGRYVDTDIDTEGFNTVRPLWSISVTDSNEPSIQSIQIAVKDNDDYIGNGDFNVLVDNGANDLQKIAKAGLFLGSAKTNGESQFFIVTANCDQTVTGTQSKIRWMRNGSEVFVVSSIGDLSKIKSLAYSWPTARGPANSVLYDNAADGTLVWSNITALVTNNQARIGPGTTNWVAKFLNPTNVQDSSILNYRSNIVELRQALVGSNYISNTNMVLRLYGYSTNADATNMYLEITSGSPFGNDHAHITTVLSGMANQRPPITINNSWAIEPNTNFLGGHAAGFLYPMVDNVYNIGSGSARINSMTIGTGNLDMGLAASKPNIRMGSGAAGIHGDADSLGFWRPTTGITAAFCKDELSGGLNFDIAGNYLAFGIGLSNTVSYLSVGDQIVAQLGELGLVQVGTNNLTVTTPTQAGFVGAPGTGSNKGGTPLRLAAGPPSGNATGGKLLFATSGSGVSGSSVQGLTNRMEIAPDTGTVTIYSNLVVNGTINGASGVANALTNNNVNAFVLFTNANASVRLESDGKFVVTNHVGSGLGVVINTNNNISIGTKVQIRTFGTYLSSDSGMFWGPAASFPIDQGDTGLSRPSAGALEVNSGTAGTRRDFFARTITSTNHVIGGAGGPTWSAGSGSPEGAVTAPVGSFYSRTDGGAATSWYVKESGAGNTGWVAK